MPTSVKSTATTSAAQRARDVVRLLAAEYPEARCALKFRDPLQLLIATILSAQCTDERVNQVTRFLFAKYRTAADYADADPGEFEREIRPTGFYRNKAKNIRACCRGLVEEYGGKVPGQMAELVRLPGIGRKTANVVLGTAMGLATGVVVDTHVIRLSRRMGLTRHLDPEKIERVLMKLIPPEEWIDFSHRMIWHGRRVCAARRPACERCRLRDVCPKIGVSRE